MALEVLHRKSSVVWQDRETELLCRIQIFQICSLLFLHTLLVFFFLFRYNKSVDRDIKMEKLLFFLFKEIGLFSIPRKVSSDSHEG